LPFVDRDGGGIYVVSALGGEARLLARFGHSPRYSPDGKWIAYVRGESGGAGGTRYVDILPADGGSPTQLNSKNLTGIQGVVWSPDSRKLLTRAGVPRQPTRWSLLGLDGSDPVHVKFAEGSLLPSGSVPFPIDWIGDQVYFAVRLGDAFELCQARLPAGAVQVESPVRRLTTGAGGIQAANVTLTSAGLPAIAFADAASDTNVWSVDLNPVSKAAVVQPRAVTTSPVQERSGSATGEMISFNRGSSIVLRNEATGRESEIVHRAAYPSLSPDMKMVAYLGPEQAAVYVRALNEPVAQVVADRSRPAQWLSDGRRLLLNPHTPEQDELMRQIRLCDTATKKITKVVEYPNGAMHSAALSPDERWMAFHVTNSPTGRTIFVVPFRPEAPLPFEQWLPITDGKGLDREPRWGPDGATLYFLSERDGFRCIWAQPLDAATKRPTGQPFPVFHGHSARRSLSFSTDTGAVGFTIARNRAYFTMSEQSGNVWILR
jgi:hypothetical protein